MRISSIADRTAGEGTIRVLTQNVYGLHRDWEKRRVVLRTGIEKLAPDLIALQESIIRQDYDQLRDFLGPDYVILHSSARDPDGGGISVASRWPILAFHELDLNVTPRTVDFPCSTLIVEVEVPQPFGPLLFVNHFPSWQVNFEHERELQAVVAAQALETLLREKPRHVILAGDLDADPDAASIRFWTGKQSLDGMSVCYRDAWQSAHALWAGGTFTVRNPLVAEAHGDWPFRHIDHIMVRCGPKGDPTLLIRSCELAFDEPVEGVWASDHFGLAADFAEPA